MSYGFKQCPRNISGLRKNSQENWFEGHKDQLTISID